nr:MAG TPA: hypothetical protein [Caudoviricetes sp.]
MQSFLSEQLLSDDNIGKYLPHTSYRGMGDTFATYQTLA